MESAPPATPILEPWDLGSRKSGIESGDTAMLSRVQRDRVLIASGIVACGFFDQEFPDHNTRSFATQRLHADGSSQSRRESATKGLEEQAPGIDLRRIQSSGVRVRGGEEGRLDNRWTKHLRELSR